MIAGSNLLNYNLSKYSHRIGQFLSNFVCFLIVRDNPYGIHLKKKVFLSYLSLYKNVKMPFRMHKINFFSFTYYFIFVTGDLTLLEDALSKIGGI